MSQCAGLSLGTNLRKEAIHISHTTVKSKRGNTEKLRSPGVGTNLLKFFKCAPFSINGEMLKMTLKVGNQYMYKKSCEIHKLGPRFEPNKK